MVSTATTQDASRGFCLHRPAAWRETATAETNSYAAEVLSEANFAQPPWLLNRLSRLNLFVYRASASQSCQCCLRLLVLTQRRRD